MNEIVYKSLEEIAQRWADPERTESLGELVAMLSPSDRAAILDGMDMSKLMYDWSFWGRPAQFVPDEPYYNVHLFSAGRGFGKTRLGSEWVRSKAIQFPGCRIGILGRSAADVRDVCALGESGILNVGPDEEKPEFKAQQAKLVWPNGSEAKLLSAETPDAVRGQQFHFTWVDELAAFTPYKGVDGLTAFDNIRIATRLGGAPQLIVTTTPKRVQILRDLIAEAREKGTVRVINGKTSDNASNLSPAYLDVIHGTFDGTSIAKQELEGVMLDDDPEGALWKPTMIRSHLLTEEEAIRQIPLRIVAVDPTVAATPGDDCGIVVVGCTPERALHRRRAFVLEDGTINASPEVWAQEVVRLARKWQVRGVVVEKNQGHDLLRMAINNIDPNLKVFPVQAGQSKALRAEPVTQIYEQGRVYHISPFTLLEDQMTSWEPNIDKKSPDRIDALVHGLTALMLKPPKGLMSGGFTASKRQPGRLPTGLGTGLGVQR